MEIYARKHSYTSHPETRATQLEAIASSDYDNIPDLIDGIEIFWNGEFQPPIHPDTWKATQAGWYHHQSGLKVKLTQTSTPDYHLVNGCGTSKVTLYVKRPSAKNSNRQIGKRPKVAKKIRLDADLVDRLQQQSASTGQSQIDIIEAALSQYFQ